MSIIPPKSSWKFILIPAVIMAVLAIYPQVSLWLTKGSPWHGAYVVTNYDEVAYSAYVNALVEGGPRRNDPFIGAADPEHESLYSIQFIPAYGIALPARFLGVSTSAVFTFLGVLFAIASCLALFWFINSVTENPMLAAAGTLIILCLGMAVAFQGELRHLAQGRVLIDFFPFLRRYQPGFAFPLFFVFCGLVWQGFLSSSLKKSILYAVASGLTLAVLVFSYFYLWTAAAAWLGCFGLACLIANRENRIRIILNGAIIGIIAVAALIPYFLMRGLRSPNLDSMLLLANTHAPEFASPSMILGLMIAIAICVMAYRARIVMREPLTLLAISFAVTPLILFNQQILTGQSLQPIHYEIFIANYMVLTALVLLGGILLRSVDKDGFGRKILIYAAGVAILVGIMEAVGPTARNAVYAEIRDESVPPIRFIQTNENKSAQKTTPVVLATNFITADFIPTISTFRPLWNPHTATAGGVSAVENKRLFYLYLYYSGFTEKDLTEALRVNSFEVTAAIFGSDRALPALGSGLAIKPSEIQAEAQKYTGFTRNFDANQASNPPLSYLIVPTEAEPDFTNLDRWYQRDDSKILGLFKVYTLTQKIAEQP